MNETPPGGCRQQTKVHTFCLSPFPRSEWRMGLHVLCRCLERREYTSIRSRRALPRGQGGAIQPPFIRICSFICPRASVIVRHLILTTIPQRYQRDFCGHVMHVSSLPSLLTSHRPAPTSFHTLYATRGLWLRSVSWTKTCVPGSPMASDCRSVAFF